MSDRDREALLLKAYGPDAELLTTAEAAALRDEEVPEGASPGAALPASDLRWWQRRWVFALGGAAVTGGLLFGALQLLPLEFRFHSSQAVAVADRKAVIGEQTTQVDELGTQQFNTPLSYESYAGVTFSGVLVKERAGESSVCVQAEALDTGTPVIVAGTCAPFAQRASLVFDINAPWGFANAAGYELDALGTDMLRITMDEDYTLHIYRVEAPD